MAKGFVEALPGPAAVAIGVEKTLDPERSDGERVLAGVGVGLSLLGAWGALDDAADFSLFEAVLYPCECCAATVALRAAHLVSRDSNGCPNHDGFPDYLCAACAKEAIKEEE